MQLAAWIIVVCYLFGVTTLGAWVARSVRGRDDFFMAGRRVSQIGSRRPALEGVV